MRGGYRSAARAGRWIALALLCAGWPAAGAATAAEGLIVAAAASLQPVFTELARRFEAQGEPRVTLVFGASGNLAQQMRYGAPYDLFAAADARWVEGLVAQGIIDPATVATFALGRLALVLRPPLRFGAESPILTAADLALLQRPEVRVVAVANPVHAPYGRAAQQALRHAKLWEVLANKRVYGENVRQALRFLHSGNAEAALVAVSLVRRSTLPWRALQPALHEPIPQAYGIARGSPRNLAARRFTATLTHPAGAALLERYGYDLVGGAPEKTP